MSEHSNRDGEKEYYSAARLYEDGKSLEAEEVLRKGLDQAPNHPWCNSLLGAILSERNLLREAEERLRKAAEAPSCDYKDFGIVRNLALFLLEKREDPKQAERVLRLALKNMERNLSEILTLLGWVFEKQERRRDARAQYLEAICRPTLPKKVKDSADRTLGYWFAFAVAGFERVSAKYRQVVPRINWRLYSAGSVISLALLLAGSVSLSDRPEWFAMLDWPVPVQVTLAIISVSFFLVPLILQHSRPTKITLGPLSVEMEKWTPRMGPGS